MLISEEVNDYKIKKGCDLIAGYNKKAVALDLSSCKIVKDIEL
jgi:hypothetical protein